VQQSLLISHHDQIDISLKAPRLQRRDKGSGRRVHLHRDLGTIANADDDIARPQSRLVAVACRLDGQYQHAFLRQQTGGRLHAQCFDRLDRQDKECPRLLLYACCRLQIRFGKRGLFRQRLEAAPGKRPRRNCTGRRRPDYLT
jgi:hypothetical protein